MNLENKQVTHGTFGKGSVLSVENGRMTVQFSEAVGKKEFSFPGAFESYLHMNSEPAQAYVTAQLQTLLNARAAQQEEKRQQRIETAERLAAEQAALRKPVRKPRKTTTTKKAVKKATTQPAADEA